MAGPSSLWSWYPHIDYFDCCVQVMHEMFAFFRLLSSLIPTPERVIRAQYCLYTADTASIPYLLVEYIIGLYHCL